MNYAEALKTQFAHLPQIRRISRHRHVPKMVYNASHQMREMKDKEKRKSVKLISPTPFFVFIFIP